MVYLQAENLSKAFGERVLFSGLSFSISKGQKVALIARNGEGKSTLIRILAGLDQPDKGSVYISKDIRLGYLQQEPQLDDEKTVIENVFKGDSPVLNAVREYEMALESHSLKEIEAATARIEALHAWDFETKVKQILYRLNITQLNQKAGSLSGGQKKRVALARILVEEPDLLLMDEPTNHLDIEMIEWLEEYLSRQNMSLLLVTHDRYFLNDVCNQIMELEDNTLYHYKGNFEYFLERKAEREINEAVTAEKTRQLYRKELDWMRRQPRARTTKAKYRVDAFKDVEERAKSTKEQATVQLDVRMSRLGSKILECHHLKKKYGDKVILEDFSYVFQKLDRIGIAGPNGVGKSTFLNLITGREEADRGRIDTGETVVFGYYTQAGLQLKEDKRVIEVVKDIAENIPVGKEGTLSASQFLQLFGFAPSRQFTFVSSLSGGEKRRLYLLTVLVRNPNFLILDEPTNDLDIVTLSTLEEFLLDFQGCLIIVSHDRYFMDKLTNHLFVFEGEGKVKDFPGTYSEYREIRKREEKVRPLESAQSKLSDSKEKGFDKLSHRSDKLGHGFDKLSQREGTAAKKKLSYKDQREFEMLEKEIGELENRKEELENKLSSGQGSFEELRQWSEEIKELMETIDSKTDRWLELSEMAG